MAGPLLTGTERVRLQIMQVQRRLTSLSLYEGPIDGKLNPETVTGVRQFQTLKGMRDTGTLAAGTLNALGVPPIV
jgi:peptidoglycan hydrolase-like protein with peptidoglycan-binding domain